MLVLHSECGSCEESEGNPEVLVLGDKLIIGQSEIEKDSVPDTWSEHESRSDGPNTNIDGITGTFD
jgi:hypothetical protein